MNIKVDNLGEYLKGKRNVEGATVREISYETGLSPGYISRIENNSSKPSFETLLKLSEALSFDLCEVVGQNVKVDDSFDILEVLSNFNLKIDGKKLSKSEKDNISNIIKLIYHTSWDNDIDKGIDELYTYIMRIKQSR